ncbi:MAG: helix-turn-helix domain-containing protein [Ardenticatenaceae bacterium]|nr:helix-turn-helix domain-containing protein [Anaerolineales bacterium]MCB8922482.1 helix-turn-helix domain-containing protein [Ardenticatenaceae bacterium]MCB8989951.1 helix-turn-helix domain-containing protein [Ardenticatenaceae bacterium]MCB9005394.1 helix-turn-helix domain-containing protein [Ardenticatenaceae bacterium]
MSETNPRAQKLGNLVEEARKHAGRSVEECAAVLQLSDDAFAAIEAGEHPISLPDLEVLSLYLHVPMGYFWGSETLVAKPHVDYMNMVALRHRMIGVLLRQYRLKEKRSVQELAEKLDVSLTQIEAYESGSQPIPYLHLEALGRFLGVSISGFLDAEHGPLSRHEAELRLVRQFDELSPQMQTFLANPQSMIYLETAQRLSQMDVTHLRQIAESILEITW